MNATPLGAQDFGCSTKVITGTYTLEGFAAALRHLPTPEFDATVCPNLISAPIGLSLNAKDETSKVGLEGSRE